MAVVQVEEHCVQDLRVGLIDARDTADSGGELRGLAILLADQEDLATTGELLEGLGRYVQVLLLREIRSTVARATSCATTSALCGGRMRTTEAQRLPCSQWLSD
jgi:hypothetical protein